MISPAASIAAPLINNPVLSLTGTFVPHARRRGSFTSLKSLLAADALQSNPGESTCNDVACSILGEHFNRRSRKFARVSKDNSQPTVLRSGHSIKGPVSFFPSSAAPGVHPVFSLPLAIAFVVLRI